VRIHGNVPYGPTAEMPGDGAFSGGAWSLRRFALTLRSSSSGVWLIPTIDIAGKELAGQLPCVVAVQGSRRRSW